ncbi:conserved hypothetical protein-like [Hymenobacter roseosalivarius DSM 11622]|uniref:Acyltransferase 3 domain-containing protein n=1 Tax=Hymenobacter roseosalivarius DSM 11622 TaxID=645990 RepID=A0A1W1VYZ7_9BACT|nr:OpgC domain-containing protein [Hymenobacter roseosalivarius]SMB98587.1 conserved hypothetical protein-like [Hymenobacter roseosalivarius DSM 11622]
MRRNLQLDFFRGVMLILITIDHFLSNEDIVKYFTYEFVGWVTAAEGFVFLSGLTAGIIYTRKLVEKGENFIAEAVKKRALIIYRNHIAILVFTLFIILLGFRIHDYWASYYELFSEKPISSLLLGMVLLYQPAYLDILPMYAVFILFVPVVLRCFKKSNVLQIFAVSFLLYLLPIINELYHFVPDIMQIRDVNTGFFNLLSWQFIFIIGLFSGFSYYQGTSRRYQVNKYLLMLSVLICMVCFIAKNIHVKLEGLDYLIARDNLGPLRVFNCLALFFIVIFISSKYNNWFKSKAICYLGRNSLEVYSFHIVLVVIFKPLEEYMNSIYSSKLTHTFYVFPLAEIMVFLLIIPALYLAPTLISTKTYMFWKSGAGFLPKEGWSSEVDAVTEDYKQLA